MPGNGLKTLVEWDSRQLKKVSLLPVLGCRAVTEHVQHLDHRVIGLYPLKDWLEMGPYTSWVMTSIRRDSRILNIAERLLYTLVDLRSEYTVHPCAYMPVDAIHRSGLIALRRRTYKSNFRCSQYE